MKMRQKNTSQRVQKNSLSQKSEQDFWREEAEMMHLFDRTEKVMKMYWSLDLKKS